MSISDTAARNHGRLFPDRSSTLQATDPELVEVFDNFAFDEVAAHGSLDEKTRMMAVLAALVARQTLGEYQVMLEGAMNLGVTPVEAKEVVYQAVPYCGIAVVLDFLHATNAVLERRGTALPLPGQATTSAATRFEAGLTLQRRIFGPGIDALRQAAPPDQAHIHRFLAANCFGDHVSRAGLDLRTRELVTFSMLAAMGGCEPQLKGHIQGNLALGNGRGTLLDALTQLLPYIGYPRTLNALRCLDEVVPQVPLESADQV